jgi:6-phosphogluconolactonase
MSLLTYSNPSATAQDLAAEVAMALQARLEKDQTACLAVSGGTTPVKFFQALAGIKLDWKNIIITLVDDRWVPESSSRSNARLVRAHLLKDYAANARFVPLVNAYATPEEGRQDTEIIMQNLPLPFAAVILGIGTDGHTASLFPGGDRLAAAFSPAHGRLVESMRCTAADEPRITFTLPVLLAADYIAILIEGNTKKRVLDAAYKAGTIEDMPIRAVLARDPAPDIFWCP